MGEKCLASVVVPTYNRLPILRKCLAALLDQTTPASEYEILLIDDGSTDGTAEYLNELVPLASPPRPNHLPGGEGSNSESSMRSAVVRHIHQANKGIAVTRNVGVREAGGTIIIFVDSDVVVTPTFVAEHLNAHRLAGEHWIICQGSPILTCNFDDPTTEPFNPLTDASRAEFDTCNVSVHRQAIIDAGCFDEDFSQYGWEDLELGIRLKKLGLKVVRRPQAVGYHYHPPFHLDMLPAMVEKEIARGRGAVLFYRKHPTLEVSLMTQMTPLHLALDWLLTWGGRLNEKNMRPVLAWLDGRGWHKACIALARALVNHYNIQEIRDQLKNQDTP